MHELEAVEPVLGAQHPDRGQELGGGKPELGVVPAGALPLAPALGGQAHAHAEVRLDAQLLRDGDDLDQLAQLLDHQDHALAQALAVQGQADEAGILVAVADDEALGPAHHGQGGHQLGL